MGRLEDKNELLSTAVKAAKAGGRVLKRYFSGGFRIDYKGEMDLVTEADREAEAVIIKTIRSSFPHHGFLAEESGEHAAKHSQGEEYKWIIDPLDGTTNFAHSFPMFCVSIGLEFRDEIILGVVFDPVRKELFAAEKEKGARLNGELIHISQMALLDRSLVVTGFAYDIRRTSENNLDHFKNFALRTQGVRRLGSAALDLCYVAAGRFDGFWELKLLPWDTAAGFLIADEAGATITDFSNQSYAIYKKEIVASNGKIHNEMIHVLNLAKRESE